MGKFVFNDPPKKSPVRIEQVWAEKPGGGVVHVTEDMPATTPVVANEDGTFMIPKAEGYVTARVGTGTMDDGAVIGLEMTTAFHEGDFVAIEGNGQTTTRAVRIERIEDGVEWEGVMLELATTIGTNFNCDDSPTRTAYKCEPKEGDGYYAPAIFSINDGGTPVYITGNDLKAEDGEYQPVRLINGANVRKETAVITEEQAAGMSGIHLV